MILVAGATGTVGSEVVRLLSARHQPAGASARDPRTCRTGSASSGTMAEARLRM